MNYIEKFLFWQTDDFFDTQTRKELSALDPDQDASEIEDRFYRDLEFGTGGLRGIMGAGTNRMNRYTVGKATKGLGIYLLNTYGKEECRIRGIVIGYDTRNNSKAFADVTAADAAVQFFGPVLKCPGGSCHYCLAQSEGI